MIIILVNNNNMRYIHTYITYITYINKYIHTYIRTAMCAILLPSQHLNISSSYHLYHEISLWQVARPLGTHGRRPSLCGRRLAGPQAHRVGVYIHTYMYMCFSSVGTLTKSNLIHNVYNKYYLK